jgi:flagellar protein FliO/FliZ
VSGSIVPVAASLAAVVVLILALGFALRRLPGATRGGGPLRIRGALAVGTRERVLWVEAGGKHLLVGVTPHNVRTLHEFAEPPAEPEARGVPSFSEMLHRAWGHDQ